MHPRGLPNDLKQTLESGGGRKIESTGSTESCRGANPGDFQPDPGWSRLSRGSAPCAKPRSSAMQGSVCIYSTGSKRRIRKKIWWLNHEIVSRKRQIEELDLSHSMNNFRLGRARRAAPLATSDGRLSQQKWTHRPGRIGGV